MIVSADRYGGDPGILVASSQHNEDDFPSPSAAAPVRGRTLPPTPRPNASSCRRKTFGKRSAAADEISC